MDANASVILAEHLKARGLFVTNSDERAISVTNPLNPDLVEAVDTSHGRYVTGWGYELGEAGDEAGTAQRLAFLLGIPNRSRTDAAPIPPGKAAAMRHPREEVFSTHPASVAQARTFVAGALTAWHLCDRHDEVRLCVSELATNAIKHGSLGTRSFRVRVGLEDARLRVEVHDGGQGAPRPKHTTQDTDQGRGLYLVAALADDWGYAPREAHGKSVWAEFEIGTTSTSHLKVITC